MSDNELDNLFKEAADGFKVPNDPSAWQEMSGRFDQAAATATFRNWKTISSLTIVGVTGIALILYLSVPSEDPDKVAASDVMLNQVIEKKSADNKSTLIDSEVSSTSANLKDKNDLVVEEKKNDATAIESRDNSERTSNAKSNSDQTESLRGIQTRTSQQNTLSSNQVIREQDQSGITNNTVNSKNEAANAESNSGSASLISEVAVIEKSLDTKSTNISVPNENNSDQTASKERVSGTQTESFAVANDSLKKFDKEQKATSLSNELSENRKSKENDTKPESINRFSVKLAFAPDYTTVKSATPNSLGINYGVLLEYRFNEHWSIATGGIWSKKIYSAYDVEYNGYHADWVDGDCRMWDIPVNLYYNFSSRKPFSFYAGLGLSSYLMNEENYVYYVETPYGTYKYPKQVKGENNEWFKTLNVSIGMQFRMNKTFSLQFEPTLKAPLTGVGEGEVSLVSLGAFLNLRFDIPNK